MLSIGLGAELDRPLYSAGLFRGRFRRGRDASAIAPFRWEEIGPSSRRRFGPAAGIPRKCNKSQFTPPVAARLVLETNVSNSHFGGECDFEEGCDRLNRGAFRRWAGPGE